MGKVGWRRAAGRRKDGEDGEDGEEKVEEGIVHTGSTRLVLLIEGWIGPPDRLTD